MNLQLHIHGTYVEAEVPLRVPPETLLTSFEKDLSLNWNSPVKSDWLTNEFYRATYLFVFPSLPGFNVAVGDPSSGPHTYAASILELRHHLPSLNLMVLPSSHQMGSLYIALTVLELCRAY